MFCVKVLSLLFHLISLNSGFYVNVWEKRERNDLSISQTKALKSKSLDTNGPTNLGKSWKFLEFKKSPEKFWKVLEFFLKFWKSPGKVLEVFCGQTVQKKDF